MPSIREQRMAKAVATRGSKLMTAGELRTLATLIGVNLGRRPLRRRRPVPQCR